MGKTKICSECGKELSLDNFGKANRNKDGLMGKCRCCKGEYDKTWVKANLEKINATARVRYLANPEKHNTAKREWHKANPEKTIIINKTSYFKNWEKHNAATRTWQKANSEQMKEARKKWEDVNPEKVRQYTQRRKAIKRSLPSTLTVAQWEGTKEHFKNTCCYCGQKLPLTQDHMVALSKGGEYTLNNILPACRSCNSSKRAKDFAEWYPKHEYYSKEREKIILDFLN